MKNMKKLVALFAATVMTMSFGASAFAATVASDDASIADGVFNLVFTPGTTEADQLTMIAYLVPDTTTENDIPAYSSQEVVAIDQVGGDQGFGEVPVDVAKLADGYAIAVAIGGTGIANPSKALITYNRENNAIYVTFMNGAETVDTVAIANGKAVLTSTVPTLAADPAYATTAYTFVGWVDAEGNAITADTDIAANTTAYAKFKSNITTGDVNKSGTVNFQDRALIHGFVKSGNNADKVQVRISHLSNAVAGDVNGSNTVNFQDRALIHGFVKNGNNADKVNLDIYVVNK